MVEAKTVIALIETIIEKTGQLYAKNVYDF